MILEFNCDSMNPLMLPLSEQKSKTNIQDSMFSKISKKHLDSIFSFFWYEKSSKSHLKKLDFVFQKSSFKKNDTSRFARFSEILYIWTWRLQWYAFQYHIDCARKPKRAPKMQHDLSGSERKHQTNSNPTIRRFVILLLNVAWWARAVRASMSIFVNDSWI